MACNDLDTNPSGDMSVALNIEADLIRLQVSGDVDPNVLLEVLATIKDSPDFIDTLNWLWDMRAASPGTSSAEDVQRVASYAKSLASQTEPTKAAFVAESNLVFGMARMSASFAESNLRKTQAFKTLVEAEAWLRE